MSHTLSTSSSRILVVDDTPANVKLLVDLLTMKGYAASSAVNGEDALAMIAAQPPDLVLLDIMMPGLSGYDVCRRLRADPATALLPVVLCTSLDAQHRKRRRRRTRSSRPGCAPSSGSTRSSRCSGGCTRS